MIEPDKLSKLVPETWHFLPLLSKSPYLHVGYWADAQQQCSLQQAQQDWFSYVSGYLPPPPAKLLLLGHDSGIHAAHLQALGFQVTFLCAWTDLQAEMRRQYPSLDIQLGDILSAQSLPDDACFDVIWVLESLQDYNELAPVFHQLQAWLTPATGRLLLTEAVSYSVHPHKITQAHDLNDIECYFAAAGFFVRQHENLSAQTQCTYRHLATDSDADILQTAELAAQRLHWQTEWEWSEKGRLGYELWLLESSHYKVQGYRNGDEHKILETFQAVFGVSRSENHWYWKFARNPFGGPFVSTVWDGDVLTAQYAAYPVPLWRNGHSSVLTQQVGDILTHPHYRGVGHGHTSLLARAYRHFTRTYCEGHIPFFYGFLTHTHLRFGQLFLNYQPITEVQEWQLDAEGISYYATCLTLTERLLGYRVEWTQEVGEWADTLFEQARHEYGWLTVRSSQYLRWRYQQNPDHRYHFAVVYKRNQPLGWWVVRVENEVLQLGDALFIRQANTLKAARIGLSMALQQARQSGWEVQRIHSWFAQNPAWWVDILKALGFCASPQPDGLTLCISPFNSPFSAATDIKLLRENWYFTLGDSSLF